MPSFTYTGDEGRDYPGLPEDSRQPEPGAPYDLDDAPDDGRWEPTAPAKTPPPPAKPAVPAPPASPDLAGTPTPAQES